VKSFFIGHRSGEAMSNTRIDVHTHLIPPFWAEGLKTQQERRHPYKAAQARCLSGIFCTVSGCCFAAPNRGSQ
jgi:hypothetical protein